MCQLKILHDDRAFSERTASRLGYRSGYYERTLITLIGKLELRVPQDRAGRFSSELFERYERSEPQLFRVRPQWPGDVLRTLAADIEIADGIAGAPTPVLRPRGRLGRATRPPGSCSPSPRSLPIGVVVFPGSGISSSRACQWFSNEKAESRPARGHRKGCRRGGWRCRDNDAGTRLL